MIEEIAERERQFDRVLAAFCLLETALEQVSQSLPDLESLVTYYETNWADHYKTDERGDLPAHLKRGVLSEDGLYNLLTDKVRLAEELRHLAQELDEI